MTHFDYEQFLEEVTNIKKTEYDFYLDNNLKYNYSNNVWSNFLFLFQTAQ